MHRYPRTRLTFVAAGSTLALLVTLLAALLLAAAPTHAAGDGTPTATPGAVPPQNDGVFVAPDALNLAGSPRVFVTRTAHFEFYDQGAPSGTNWAALAAAAEPIYRDVRAAVGAGIDRPIRVVLRAGPLVQANGCPIRGLAHTGPDPLIELFLTPDAAADLAYLRGVLAHEVGHILHRYGLGADLMHHTPVIEGFATWVAAPYWNRWQGTRSLDDAVRETLRAGEYLSLAAHYDLALAYSGENCLPYRDQLYTAWASFVGWLGETYGTGALLDLMRSNPPDAAGRWRPAAPDSDKLTWTVGSIRADFEGIYGESLAALEAAWLADLRAGWLAPALEWLRAAP